MSSTKPEVLMYCIVVRREPRNRHRYQENFVKFEHVIFETCECTDRQQTDIQTRSMQYFAHLADRCPPFHGTE